MPDDLSYGNVAQRSSLELEWDSDTDLKFIWDETFSKHVVQ